MKYSRFENFNITFHGICFQNIFIKRIKIFIFFKAGEEPSLLRGKLKGLFGFPFLCTRMYIMSRVRINSSTKQACKFYWNSNTLYPLCISVNNCKIQRANGGKRSNIKAPESRRKLINLLLSYNFILVVSLIAHIYNPYPMYFNCS